MNDSLIMATKIPMAILAMTNLVTILVIKVSRDFVWLLWTPIANLM